MASSPASSTAVSTGQPSSSGMTKQEQQLPKGEDRTPELTSAYSTTKVDVLLSQSPPVPEGESREGGIDHAQSKSQLSSTLESQQITDGLPTQSMLPTPLVAAQTIKAGDDTSSAPGISPSSLGGTAHPTNAGQSAAAGTTAGARSSSELRPLAPAPLAPSQKTTAVPTIVELPIPPAASSMTNSSVPPRVIHTTQTTSTKASTSGSPTNVPSKSTSPKGGSNLRRGKWTVEEESYVARVIQDFNSGFLDAPAGTTLRSYLSEKLQCDPMRITKKFTGEACIGKRVFHPAVRSAANAATIDKAQAELDTLEKRWRRRLEMQQRESAKKAAASAAAASAATAVGGHSNHAMIQGVPVALLSSGVASNNDVAGNRIGQSVVTQAASWLDRANAILKGAQVQGFPIAPVFPNSSTLFSKAQAPGDSTPDSVIENEMQEVERLIHEGPRIQETAAGFPNILTTNQRLSGSLEGPPSPPEPADKRMRTGAGGTISGAEDAEALVGFLRSVRAAAGQDTS